MSTLLGVDLGTSGVKVLAVDADGGILASENESYPLYQPRAGWSEQDPAEWWESVLEALRRVTDQPAVDASSIRGLAVSGQMHGSVFLDRKGEVIRRPLLWNDTRTVSQCETITRTLGEKQLLERVGNPALEGFTAPKVLWLKENEPENFDRLSTLLLPKDYVLYRLTGRLCTAVSDAAGTLLFAVEKRRWSRETVDQLGLDAGMLPDVLESIEPVGEVNDEVASETGLPDDAVVVAGGADNACSAVGTGIIEEGLVSASIGSSGVVLGHTDGMKLDPGGRIHSFNHSVPDRWYLMGVMLSAAMSLNWYHEKIDAREIDVRHLDEEAAEVPPGSEGVVFLPYINGERTPHRDPRARGVFFGLSQVHSRQHLNRAVLEGVVYGLRDSLELMKNLGVEPSQIRATGGGAQSPLWRQILADVFNHEVVTMEVEEGPAFGAALLAGVGVGLYRDVSEAVSRCVRTAKTVSPDPEHAEVYEQQYPLYRSLYSSLKDDFARSYELYQSRREDG